MPNGTGMEHDHTDYDLRQRVERLEAKVAVIERLESGMKQLRDDFERLHLNYKLGRRL